MNKIYRVVRNASTGNWVVVSELTHGRGKGKSGRASKPALLALAMAMASPAMATSIDSAVTVPGSQSSPWTLGDRLNVGDAGVGSLNVTAGGTVSNLVGSIGDKAGAQGTVTVDAAGGAASWSNNGTLYVGNNGTGDLHIANGGVVTSTAGQVGMVAGSEGNVEVDGAGSSWTVASTAATPVPGNLNIGNAGSGELSISNGATVSNGAGNIGVAAGSTGKATVGTNAVWNNTGALTVGSLGSGELNILSGGAVNNAAGSIANGAGSTGTVTVSGAGSTWTNRGLVRVGGAANSNGTLVINDGAAVTSTTGSLGAGTGATGNATISGTGSSWKTTSGTFNVGGTGTGHLIIENGGLLQNTGAPADPSAFGYSVIGSTDTSGATSTAKVTGAGSTWSTDGIMTVGYMAAGDLQVLDGGTVTTKGVEMARNARGSGNVTVAGANSLLSSDGGYFRVGSFGTADLTITDGGRVEVRGGASTIGNNATAVGTATVSNGGSWATLDNALYVGMLGTGTLTVSDGGVVESKGGILGDSTGTGAVTVTGDGSQWTNGGYTLEIGAGGSSGNGTGSVTIADGGLVQNKMGRLGRYAGATGTLTISDANSVWQNDGQLVVGDAGTGTLSIGSGATVTSVGAAIANEAGAAGNVTVDGAGSQLNVDGALVVGNAGAATLTITDQAAVRAGAVSLANSADAVATLNIGTGALAGTLEADSITGGAGTATINLDHTDTIELAGMSGNLTVNKYNTGTVRLLGASDYAGTTTVDGGMLQAGIANAFSSNADYTLASSAVLDMGGFDQGMASLANAGVVAFAGTSATTPAAGATLTVAGDYVGNGGTLLMNSVLGGDDSVTDKLVVGGSTSGETFVQVQNVGGVGAVTDNGIQLVSVAGASDGVFELQGRAVGGLYDYALQKGGRNTPDDGGWYLRSEALPTPPAPEVPVIDPPAPTPVLRPEPAAYLGNQTAALRMFQGTMHDRVGEPGLTARNDAGQGYAAWVRVQSGNLDAGTVGGQIDIDSNANVMQMGVEKQFAVGEGRVHAGLMGGYGRATTNGSSEFTDYRARGEVSGKNVGLYGTWFQNADGPEGLYVDGAAQYGTFDNTVKGDYLSRERYDSKVWSASVETGYAFNVHSGERYGVYVEPQAQVIYSDFSSDDVVESNGTVVQTHNAGGTTTRLGARVYGRPTSAQFNRVQPFVAVNWWSGGNDSTIAMDGERLSRDLSNNTYEAKVGAQLELGQGWSGWGQMGYQEGSNGYRDVNGQIGVKLSW